MFGVDLARYDRIVDLRDKLAAGNLRLEPGDVLVGLNWPATSAPTSVTASPSPDGTAGSAGERFQIVGMIDPGNRDLSRRSVYLPLHVAQNFLRLPGGVTSIDLRVQDVFAANTVADRVARVAPLTVESWMLTNNQLLSALNAQTMATGMIRIFVSIVVMLGIASVLVVAVVQKTRGNWHPARDGRVTRADAAGVPAAGWSGWAVWFDAGAGLSAVLIFGFSHFVRGADGNPLFPIALTGPLLAYACITATLCGMLAAIAPARRAARLDPALAMRA